MARANLGPEGVEGDRQYGLIDAANGLPAIPEKDMRWRKSLYLQAGGAGVFPTIFFPAGLSCSVGDLSVNAALTDYFGFPTAVAAYDHTERRAGYPLTQFRHRHFPMHILTTASLEHLASLRKVYAIDSRRFRPTILIDADNGGGFLESGWIGRRLRIGPVGLTAKEDTKRCGVTFISQPGIEEDPEILRGILRHNRRNLGIYCSVDSPGSIQLGDELLIDF